MSALTKNDSVACNSTQPSAKHTSEKKTKNNNNTRTQPLNCTDDIFDSVNFVAYVSRLG